MGRLSRLYGNDEAEFSLEVRDAFQRHGLGTELLHRLIAIGRHEQLRWYGTVVLPQNLGMLPQSARSSASTPITRRPIV